MNKGLLIGIGAGVTALSGLIVTKLVLKSKRRKAWLEALEKDTEKAVLDVIGVLCHDKHGYKGEELLSKLKLLYNEVNNETEITMATKNLALVIIANNIADVGGCNSCDDKAKAEPVKEEPKAEPVKEEPKAEPVCPTLQKYLKDLRDSFNLVQNKTITKCGPKFNEIKFLDLVRKCENLANDLIESSVELEESKTEQGKAIINEMGAIRREVAAIRTKFAESKAEPVKEEPKAEPVKEEPVKEEPVKEEPKAEPVKEEPKAEPVKEEPKAEPVKKEPKTEQPDEIAEAITGLTKVLDDIKKSQEPISERLASLDNYIAQVSDMIRTVKKLKSDALIPHVKSFEALKVRASKMITFLKDEKLKNVKEEVESGKPFEEVEKEIIKEVTKEHAVTKPPKPSISNKRKNKKRK